MWNDEGKSRDRLIKDINDKITNPHSEALMKMVIRSIDLVIERNDELLKYVTENRLSNKNEVWNACRLFMSPDDGWIPFWTYQVIYGIIACMH